MAESKLPAQAKGIVLTVAERNTLESLKIYFSLLGE
jgi:hypothetical protein